jgi:hypothetical protein
MLVTTSINGRGEAGQDHFAFRACGEKRNGTFLDIGCNEPILFNNTYALEEIGWRGWGLDIEPAYVDMWKKTRKSPFYLQDAVTVDWHKLIGFPQLPIDYLSLDIDENTEHTLTTTILNGLFAAGLTFRCATVEHDAYRHPTIPRNAIREVMQANGYKIAYPDVEIRQGCGKPFEDWWLKA